LTTSAATEPSTLAPMKIPVFRALWLASMASNFGWLIQGVGAAWLMTTIAGSADMVALVQTSTTLPIMLFSLLAGAVVAVLVLRDRVPDADPEQSAADPEVSNEPAVAEFTSSNAASLPPRDAPEATVLPRLVDLGAGKCIPCKMMAPILKELSENYADTFTVDFIDVWENPDAGETYGIRVIPTQIFYDAEGKELFRHEGFFGKQDILAKWKEHGVHVSAGPGG